MKIAISGKGGVGKTTLSAALALLLADRGKKVLAIDADASETEIVPISFGGKSGNR